MSTESNISPSNVPVTIENNVNNQEISAADTSSVLNRQTLIATATKFLQNPKVISTPLENKRLFLAKKGLTNEEIEIALRSAGCYNTISEDANKSQYQQSSHDPSIQFQHQIIPTNLLPINRNQNSLTSIFFKIAKWLANIIIAGCVSFAAYKFLLKKYFSTKQSKTEIEIKKLIEKNNQFDDRLKEIRESIVSLKESIDNTCFAITKINADKIPGQLSTEQDIKAEIQSIKSLLLNRTQFPALPTVTPVLPTWQLAPSNQSKNPKKDSITDGKIVKDDYNNKSDINGDINETMSDCN